jgi:hypothetical protein
MSSPAPVHPRAKLAKLGLVLLLIVAALILARGALQKKVVLFKPERMWPEWNRESPQAPSGDAEDQ